MKARGKESNTCELEDTESKENQGRTEKQSEDTVKQTAEKVLEEHINFWQKACSI